MSIAVNPSAMIDVVPISRFVAACARMPIVLSTASPLRIWLALISANVDGSRLALIRSGNAPWILNCRFLSKDAPLASEKSQCSSIAWMMARRVTNLYVFIVINFRKCCNQAAFAHFYLLALLKHCSCALHFQNHITYRRSHRLITYFQPFRTRI